MSVRTTRRTSRMAAVVVAVSALVCALVPGQAARAAEAEEPPWVLQLHDHDAFIEWTLAGRVAGAPGNVHTGSFEVDMITGTWAELWDYSCPAGVTEPTAACELVGHHSLKERSTLVGDYGKWLVRNRLAYPVTVRDEMTNATSTTRLDLRAHGLAPNTMHRAFYTYVGNDGVHYRGRYLMQHRPAVFSGKVLSINLRDPRLEIGRSYVFSYDEWSQVISPSPS